MRLVHKNFWMSWIPLGFEQSPKPEAIVIMSKKDFSAEEYASMIEKALDGEKSLGCMPPASMQKTNVDTPGVGAIYRCSRMQRVKAYEVVGKPGTCFTSKA